MEPHYWLILGLVLLICEVFTLDFSLSCFGTACLAAAGVSAAGLGIYWQLITVTAVIVLLLFTLRPLALKYLIRAKDFKDNIAALIGKTASVFELDTNNPNRGWVKIDGDNWAVEAQGALAVGNTVKIEKVDGSTLIVTKENN